MTVQRCSGAYIWSHVHQGWFCVICGHEARSMRAALRAKSHARGDASVWTETPTPTDLSKGATPKP